MDKATLNLIYCFSLAVTILICLFGCGERVTSTERTEIKKDSLHIENKVELTQNATWSDIGSVKPFDAKKPMLWGGKWYYNTIIEFDKTIKKEIEIKAGESLSYTGSESVEVDRNTKKTDNGHWVLIIGTLFVLYLALTKYKIL